MFRTAITEMFRIGAPGGGLEELIPLTSGRRIEEGWETGNVERAPLMVGPSIGLIEEVPTCRELLEGMARECGETLERVGRMAGLER